MAAASATTTTSTIPDACATDGYQDAAFRLGGKSSRPADGSATSNSKAYERPWTCLAVFRRVLEQHGNPVHTALIFEHLQVPGGQRRTSAASESAQAGPP